MPDPSAGGAREHGPILLVEDDRELRLFLQEILEEAGYSVQPLPSAGRALAWLAAGEPAELVVTDLVMPGMGGGELVQDTRRLRPELNVLVITAFGSIESAIGLVKAGAYDYLTKPFGTDEFLLAVERALQESRLRREVARLSKAAAAPPPGFVGASRPIQEIFVLLRKISTSPLPVLVTGETGTGKEVVAQALHRLSNRGSFVAVNCAAFPEHLLESELFGHEKGAFTGADRAKAGLFMAADGGTLFLDEIGELPSTLQPKLLRALEEGEVRPVGSNRSTRVDVRIVAATNRDLEESVRGGGFREDLFWRLNVLVVRVPPLRERPADVLLLAEHFLERSSGGGSNGEPPSITPEAMALLTAYSWPGNVRELRNVIERARTLSTGSEIGVHDFPERIRASGGSARLLSESAGRRLSLRELERKYILEVLRQTGGNRSRAAGILGLDRKTLYRKLQEYGGESLSGS